MDSETLKRIIESQREDIEEKFKNEKIIGREGAEYAKKFLNYPNVLALLGVRRSGKSVFSILASRQLSEKRGYINFIDERLVNVKTEDLDKILQAFYELYGDVDLIILDEMQNVYGWELFVSRLRTTKKIIITGSNSKLLSGELATHLTGRHIDLILYPFSFKEFLSFKPNIYSTKSIAEVKNALKQYMAGSGFPEFIKFGREIVTEIYNDVLTRDCLRRHKIREEKSFRELASYLISNFSNEFTYSKLSRIVGIKDVHTLKNYVDYLVEAYLIVVLERYSPKLKQQIIAPKKAYAIDHGFCNFVSFRLTKDFGKIFENIVCIELLRKKVANHKIGVYYWKNAQQEEADFVVKEGLKVKQIIQICYDISDLKTKERELKALLKASKELKCSNLLVITDDKEGEERINSKTINFIPLWKWLLWH